MVVAVFLISVPLLAQESKLELNSNSIFIPVLEKQLPNFEIENLLTGRLSCSVVGISMQQIDKSIPFRMYQIHNRNWVQNAAVYNAIRATVPSVQISCHKLNRTPTIGMRGDDAIVVLVDGIRSDTSILNVWNPADIERVQVSNDPVAESYFRFAQ